MGYDGIRLKERISDAQCFGLGFALDEAVEDFRNYLSRFKPQKQESLELYRGTETPFSEEFEAQFHRCLKKQISPF